MDNYTIEDQREHFQKAQEYQELIEFMTDFTSIDFDALYDKFQEWRADGMPSYSSLSHQAQANYSY